MAIHTTTDLKIIFSCMHGSSSYKFVFYHGFTLILSSTCYSEAIFKQYLCDYWVSFPYLAHTVCNIFATKDCHIFLWFVAFFKQLKQLIDVIPSILTAIHKTAKLQKRYHTVVSAISSRVHEVSRKLIPFLALNIFLRMRIFILIGGLYVEMKR